MGLLLKKIIIILNKKCNLKRKVSKKFYGKSLLKLDLYFKKISMGKNSTEF